MTGDEFAALRRTSLAPLRGLALARSLDIRQGSAEAERDLLKQMLVERMECGRST